MEKRFNAFELAQQIAPPVVRTKSAPLKQPEHARDFCEDFCEVISRRHPERTPLGMTVVSACDAPYFAAAQLLFVSLRMTHDLTRFVLYDLGLTAQQREWCLANGAELRTLMRLTHPAMMPENVPGWQTWNKPFYLADAAARYGGPLLWLDADTLAVGPLDWIEETVTHRPFVVHCFAATNNLGYRSGMRSLANRDRLYDRYPVARRMTLDRPNAGVFACDVSRPLDRRLLDDWQFMVGEAARDDDVLSCLRWFDQGALQWALEKNDLINVVTHEQRFNNGTLAVNAQTHPSHLLAALDETPLQTRLLHFPAGSKPYAKLPEWLPFEISPPRLAVFVLGHEAERLANCPRSDDFCDRHVVRHVFLPALDPANDLAESRVFHADTLDHCGESYVALCSARWNEKYAGECLPLARLGELPLLPRVVWAARLSSVDWLAESERDHPGMRAIVESLADEAGIDQASLRRSVPWSNNLTAHRGVVQAIVAFHRRWWPWCAARLGGYDTSRWDRTRHGSYLAERLTMVFLCGRGDLEMRQMPI